ncbi:hypothetical protein [Curtobacterium ammoniigenes]|uniref:hypothetical protein n=1 Tax=Curtobacterium ammoniigenes TaxID=395387 RepID=UPI0008337C01|nr:hypothetical protein [Curtobacterium ammoniigenes]
MTNPPVPVVPSPTGGGFLAALLGAGLVGFLLMLAIVVVAFVLNAWIAGIWLRLLVRFHRGWFDREYARARGVWGPNVPPSPEGRRFLRERGPRDW